MDGASVAGSPRYLLKKLSFQFEIEERAHTEGHCRPSLEGMTTAMGEATDKDDFHAYAVHCEEMAASATEADIKELWLRMAAAWRRQAVEPPKDTPANEK